MLSCNDSVQSKFISVKQFIYDGDAEFIHDLKYIQFDSLGVFVFLPRSNKLEVQLIRPDRLTPAKFLLRKKREYERKGLRNKAEVFSLGKNYHIKGVDIFNSQSDGDYFSSEAIFLFSNKVRKESILGLSHLSFNENDYNMIVQKVFKFSYEIQAVCVDKKTKRVMLVRGNSVAGYKLYIKSNIEVSLNHNKNIYKVSFLDEMQSCTWDGNSLLLSGLNYSKLYSLDEYDGINEIVKVDYRGPLSFIDDEIFIMY